MPMTLDNAASCVRTGGARRAGYTLVELIVAVGFFTLIMTLASGAYLVMINTNRQAQGIANGINNLSFAIETMMYNIRTGTGYECAGAGDCPNGESELLFTDADGHQVTYELSASAIQQTKNGTTNPLTDSTVDVSTLTFYVTGTDEPPSDYTQPYVTIVVHGTVSVGPGKPPQPFTIETGAAMRGTDL